MESKITNIHAYDEDGTAYIAVPSIADKALKDATGAVISDKYATKTEVEQALAGTGGESAVFKVENDTTYNDITQAVADGKWPVRYYQHRWYHWSENTSGFHYFVSVDDDYVYRVSIGTDNGWTSVVGPVKLIKATDVIKNSAVEATEDDEVYSGKVCDQKYALKNETSVGEGGGVKVIQFNTTSQNPTTWQTVKDAIDSGYPVALETTGTVYWLQHWLENPALGRNFAWFASTMNVSGNANGVNVMQCRYDVASGQTTWTTAQNSWLRRMDVEGVYYKTSDALALEGRVEALENGGGTSDTPAGSDAVKWADLDEFTESDGDYGKWTRFVDTPENGEPMQVAILCLTKDGSQGGALNGQTMAIDTSDCSNPYLFVYIADAQSSADVSGFRIQTDGEWEWDFSDGAMVVMAPADITISYDGGNVPDWSFTTKFGAGSKSLDERVTSLEQRVDNLENAVGQDGWKNLPEFSESEDDMFKLTRLYDGEACLTILTMTKSMAEGSVLNGQRIIVDYAGVQGSKAFLVIVADAESDADVSRLKVAGQDFAGGESKDGGYDPSMVIELTEDSDIRVRSEEEGSKWEFGVKFTNVTDGGSGSGVKVATDERNLSENGWYQSEGIWKYLLDISNVVNQLFPNDDKRLDLQKDLLIIDVMPVSKKQAYDAGWLGVVQIEGSTVTLGCVDQPNNGEIWVSIYLQANH